MEIGIDTFAASYTNASVESNEKSIGNLIERIVFADKVNLDVYGIGEHHGKDMLDSAPVVILGAAAARTNRIRLTSAVTGVATADPVRIFQEFATLDLISNGRAEIVAGRGASVEAFSLFGISERNITDMFSENLELLLEMRKKEIVNWSGKYRSPLANIGIYPRPFQETLPIWHAALRTPASFIRAGELGLPLMLAIIDGRIEQYVPMVELYKEAGRDAGFNDKQLKVGFHTMGYVAETTDKAIEEFYPGWAISMNKAHGTPKTRARFDIDLQSKGSALVVGGPEEVADKILRLSEALGGISRFCFQMDYAGLPHEKLMKSIELIGNNVIPLIKSKCSNS